MLLVFIKRLMLGLPPLVPGYGINFLAVFALNSLFHFQPVGIVSTAFVGSLFGYALNTFLAPHFLAYYRWTGYYSEQELSGISKRLHPEVHQSSPT